jgi:hypothetical protein
MLQFQIRARIHQSCFRAELWLCEVWVGEGHKMGRGQRLPTCPQRNHAPGPVLPIAAWLQLISVWLLEQYSSIR